MLAAVTTFSVMDVLLKTLSEDYPAMQVTFLRGAASLPLLLGANAVFGRWRDLVAKRWHLHVMRGFLSVALLWCFVYAVSQLSLANAYSIFMSAPLLITALSVLMLGERVGWRQWLAIFVGLAGVIIVLKPTGGGLVTIGGLAALASAAGYALNAITIRILTRTDSSAATVFWSVLHHRSVPARAATRRRAARIHGARVGHAVRLAAMDYGAGAAHAHRRTRDRRQRHLHRSPRTVR